MTKFGRSILPLLSMWTVAAANAAAPPASLNVNAGVLEQGKRLDTGGTPIVQVRLAFQKIAGQWRGVWKYSPPVLEPLSPEINWRVMVAGAAPVLVKTVQGEAVAVNGPLAHALRVHEGENRIPRIDLGSLEIVYRDWTPTSRPLLATSAAAISDPDGWKSSVPSSDELQKARDAFRSLVPLMRQCDAEMPAVGRLVKYTDEDIELRSLYRSGRGHLILAQRLTSGPSPCDGGPGRNSNSAEIWLAFGPAGSVQELGTALIPLGAADLDADGRSEWVFKFDEVFSDGYIMYYDDFSKRVMSIWEPPGR